MGVNFPNSYLMQKRKYVAVSCPACGMSRNMRHDQHDRNVKNNRPFYCLPCGTANAVRVTKQRVFDTSKYDWPNNSRSPRNPLYSRWQKMRRRCEKDSSHAKWYADMGVFVCREWESYETFRVWALENGFHKSLELDRTDPNGPYSPQNCRWITHADNCRNRRPRGLSKIKSLEIH